jgi:16S rRNA (guanine527-N7)-methyltransferase
MVGSSTRPRAAKKGQQQREGELDLTEFLRLASTYKVEPTSLQIEQIKTHVLELLRWNQKVNLTAARDPAEVLNRHVLDSLVPLAHLSGARRLLDVGPGGGFPGIPIKVFRPELFVVLIEARRKKAAFNQHIVDMLELQGVEVVWGRLGDEEIDQRFFRSPFDAVITRATLPGTDILRLAARVLRPGGTVLLMKGAMGEGQEEELQQQVRKQGRSVVRVFPYRLPGTGRTRNLVLIR